MSFDLSTISSSNTNRASCTIIHGVGGIGKTTFGAQACLAKKGLMVLGEDGLSPLGLSNVPRIFISRWGTIDAEGYKNEGNSLQDVVRFILVEKHDYNVVVFDPFDAFINPLDEYVVQKFYNGDSNKAMEFHKKYNEYNSEVSRLLKAFKLIQEKGVEIIVMVHSIIAPHRDPSVEGYNRWNLNLPSGNKTSVANMLYNYADNCFFANYEVVVNDGKAAGSNRVMYTRWDASYDAKTRYDLPPKVRFDYSTFCETLSKVRK